MDTRQRNTRIILIIVVILAVVIFTQRDNIAVQSRIDTPSETSKMQMNDATFADIK